MKKLYLMFIPVILVILIVFVMHKNPKDSSQGASVDKPHEVSIIVPEETMSVSTEILYSITGNDLHIGDVVFTDCIDRLTATDSPYTIEEFCNYIAMNTPDYFSGECYLSVHSYLDDPYYTNIYADYTAYEDPSLAELIRTYNEYPTCEIILLSSDLTESVQIESCSKYVFKKEVNYGEN